MKLIINSNKTEFIYECKTCKNMFKSNIPKLKCPRCRSYKITNVDKLKD